MTAPLPDEVRAMIERLRKRAKMPYPTMAQREDQDVASMLERLARELENARAQAAADRAFQNDNARLALELAEARGAMAADDERLLTAARRVDLDFGCDSAEHMADCIEHLRARLSEANDEIVNLREELTGLDLSVERDDYAGKVPPDTEELP